ncbi:hypothetical protein OROMI_016566 [Orobanche minor]
MDSTISSFDEKLKTSSKKRKIEGDDEFNSDAPTPAKKYLVNTTATITSPCKLVPKRFGTGKSKSVPVASKPEVSLNSCMSPVHYGSSIEKIEGDLFGKNDMADRHIDRIFSSYNQRRKNEFNDFMKPDDAKFETRTSLNKLSLLNGKLQPHQKKYIEEMGLLSITKIEFEHLDRELVRWLEESEARAANETHNNSWLDKDATQNSVFPNKEKDRSRIEADENITNEKKSKEQDFDCPVMGVDHDDVVSPPMHSWGFADGYASTDTSSEDEQQKKLCPKSLILLTGNSTGLNDHLLSQQIKLIQELKDYMSEMPKIMKSTIRCVMSEFVPEKHQSGSTRRKNKGIIHPVLLSGYVNSEDDVENNNILRCNPTSTEEEIVQFLFDSTLPHSTKVIDYGGYHLSREDLKTLSSKCKIKGTVIDVVAYVCTGLVFPINNDRYIPDGKKDNDKLLDWYFKGDGSFTNSIEHLERVHFPIHDQQDHCKKEHRRNLIQRVVQRFDNLMHKYAGKNYKVKDAKNFLYEGVSRVPRQNNGCTTVAYMFA